MTTKLPPDTDVASASGLLTAHHAAQLLFISGQTLNKWRLTGYGPAFVEIGRRHFRYRRQDIDAWLSGQVKTPTTSDAKSPSVQPGVLRKRAIST